MTIICVQDASRSTVTGGNSVTSRPQAVANCHSCQPILHTTETVRPDVTSFRCDLVQARLPPRISSADTLQHSKAAKTSSRGVRVGRRSMLFILKFATLGCDGFSSLRTVNGQLISKLNRNFAIPHFPARLPVAPLELRRRMQLTAGRWRRVATNKDIHHNIHALQKKHWSCRILYYSPKAASRAVLRVGACCRAQWLRCSARDLGAPISATSEHVIAGFTSLFYTR